MPGSIIPRPSDIGADLSFRDFRADKALGRSTLYGQMAEVAAQKICGLYGKSPSTLVRLIPVGSGLIDNSRGVFDDLCENEAPLPPPPAPQFQGGQCDAVLYNVRINQRAYFSTSVELFFATRAGFSDTQIYGPIGGVRMALPSSFSANGQTRNGYKQIEVFCRGDSSGVPKVPGWYNVVGSSSPDFTTASLENLGRVGGAPDNCGNPAPSYPLPTATPDDLQGTAIINIAPNVPITVPVTNIPTFAPVFATFRPEFNVNVGGINVNISAGGFTFSPTLEIAPNINVPFSDPRASLPPALPITPPSTGGGSSCDLTPVLDKVKEVKDEMDRCCDRLSPYSEPLTSEYDIAILGTGIAGTLNLPARTFRVTVQVVNRPQNEKTIYGNGSDDVLFCGWAWFNRGGGLSERLPIDAANKSYEPPARSEGTFVYAMYAGYTATIRAYYAKPGVKP